MSENLFGLTVAADKGLDDLQCQRLLSENRRYQEVMLLLCYDLIKTVSAGEMGTGETVLRKSRQAR